MTYYQVLDIEQVIYIHEKIIDWAGGKQGVRDYALLHSALGRCRATFGGKDLYPSILLKSAALLHSLTMNHPFLDGNKRTAFAVMTRFLNANGRQVSAAQGEIITMCVGVDNKGWKVKQIVGWLKVHTRTMGTEAV